MTKGKNNILLRRKIKFITKNSSRAFTLIELLVAISIFVAAVTSITAIYIAVIRSQQKSNLQRLVSQDARYALETITREVRMATGTNTAPAIKVEGNQLTIVTQNYETGTVETKTFTVNNNEQLVVSINNGPQMRITSDKLRVTEFKLENYVPDSDYDPVTRIPKRQPSVTITITTEQKEENVPAYRRAKTTLRTTISSRDYRYQD